MKLQNPYILELNALLYKNCVKQSSLSLQLDFVVGIRVVLSNNHNCKGFKPGTFHDICDELSAPIDYKDGDKRGLYPKDFKFTGWHPQCRCHAVPVLKTQDEFLADLDRPKGEEAAQSIHEVTDVPQEFKNWVNENKEKIQAAEKRGTLPYFIKDNQERVNDILNPEEPADNLSELAAKLGITKGKPMTHEEADFGLGNPHYKGRYTDPYSVNCQSCVVAYEARRRGLDVAAMPNFGIKGTAAERLSLKDSLAWIDPLTGEHAKITRAASPRWKGSKMTPATYAQIVKGVKEATQEEGRYVISLCWKRKSDGHIFCVEKLKDGTYLSFDPQNGKSRVLNKYLKDASGSRTVNVIRVDNKQFDLDIASKVLTKQSTERFAGVAEARAAKGGVLGVPKGKLTTDPERIELANKNKQERAKFEKEQRMCKVLVDNGHNVRHLSDVNGGHDIELDGVPYELKSLRSANNIVNEGKDAIRKQGANGVVFEFSELTPKIRQEINKLRDKYDIHGYYFIKGKNEIETF